MKKSGLMATGMVCATALVISGMLARAGNLNPPLGPVAPTGPMIIDALPVVIDTPGSYVLNGDLTGIFNRNGIVITVSDVTLDMRGFSLIGVFGAGTGIFVSSSFGPIENVSIRNGTLRDWPGPGVDVRNSEGSHLANLHARGNDDDGILAGPAALIQNCVSVNNTNRGIVAGEGSLISQCVSRGNSSGISALGSSSIESCIAVKNAGDGFFAAPGSSIIECSARDNGNDGICAESSSTIRDCTSTFNDGDGIQVLDSCVIVGNNCEGNGQDGGLLGAGINATGSDNRVESNHLCNNTRGVRLAGTGTYLADNTIKGNTTVNHDLAAGNLVNVLLCEMGESFSVPASIKLAGSLIATSPAATTGIGGTGQLSIDLGGHVLDGGGSGAVGASGRLVRNGMVEGWGSLSVSGGVASDLLLQGGVSGGIIERCSATNGSLSGTIVSHCVSSGSPSIGISGDIVSESRASGATSDGIQCLVALGCFSSGNTVDGIEATLCTNSFTFNNDINGISSNGLVRGNVASGDISDLNNLGGATFLENDTN